VKTPPKADSPSVFVERIHGKTNDAIIILVDGTGLIHSYKAFVAALAMSDLMSEHHLSLLT
jgi:hypothetical protein